MTTVQTGHQITKAMLLAAGLGTRLRPLTHTVPKPMLPVQGKPLIDYALTSLARARIRDVMLNLHHLPEQIQQHVGDGTRYGVCVHYSFEPKILGTGGGIKNCERFFGRDPFVVMNADTLIDLDLQVLINHHATHGAAGTLVIRPLAPGETYNPLTIRPDGHLAGFGKGTHFYAGVQACTISLLSILPVGRPCCLIREGLEPLLARGETIATLLHTGAWNDVGTPERYALATQQPWSGVDHR